MNIEELSRREKLRMMEALWDDLTHDKVTLPSPEWHGDALKEAEQAKKRGEANFVEWEAVKNQLRNKR